jgi:small redox-active disulfide protein 2
MKVKILGTGCANCRRLEALVSEVAAAEGLQCALDRLTAIPDIMGYGILHTPGLVVDDEVKASGRIPSRSEIAGWLRTAADTTARGTAGN